MEPTITTWGWGCSLGGHITAQSSSLRRSSCIPSARRCTDKPLPWALNEGDLPAHVWKSGGTESLCETAAPNGRSSNAGQSGGSCNSCLSPLLSTSAGFIAIQRREGITEPEIHQDVMQPPPPPAPAAHQGVLRAGLRPGAANGHRSSQHSQGSK